MFLLYAEGQGRRRAWVELRLAIVVVRLPRRQRLQRLRLALRKHRAHMMRHGKEGGHHRTLCGVHRLVRRLLLLGRERCPLAQLRTSAPQVILHQACVGAGDWSGRSRSDCVCCEIRSPRSK